MDQPTNGSTEPQSGDVHTGDVPNATGAMGLVGVAQFLGEPWRTVASVAGPWLVVIGRWLVPRLVLALHLLEISAISYLIDWLVKNEDEKKHLMKQLQEARKVVLDRLTFRIRRGK